MSFNPGDVVTVDFPGVPQFYRYSTTICQLSFDWSSVRTGLE